jgi:N-acetyl-alpha-D-glucosaminyl L-malate synthase BshA
MRIGITCFPSFGGSGIIATEIGLSLARRGHYVHFICTDLPWRFDRFVENVYFHEVEARDYPLFDQSPYTLALTSKMVEVATWEHLDLLHVHYAIPHAASAYLARQILGRAAPRIITTLHGTDITVVGADPSFLPVTRFAIEQSDGVTVPSADLRRSTYERLGVSEKTPIEVIPNFVDTDAFAPAPRSAATAPGTAPGPSPGTSIDRPPTLVHNSNFRPVKRVDDVIEVFARVSLALPTCELVLIGDGPERSRIERLVHERGLGGRVRFLGKQLHVAPILQKTDLFLLPSETESFGLAALEALSCGVPVLASRVGGLPEVISDGKNGALVPLGDVAAMARAAIDILGDAPLQARLAAGARATAVEKFPREPMVTRYEKYYERIISTSNR